MLSGLLGADGAGATSPRHAEQAGSSCQKDENQRVKVKVKVKIKVKVKVKVKVNNAC
jgi:hypothetical protein